MNKNLSVTSFIEIKASSAEVWDALINPEKIKTYFFGTNTTSDWKKGGSIVFEGEFNGQHYRDGGKIIEFIPEEILEYSYWTSMSGLEDKPENYSRVTFSLDNDKQNTILTVIQQGYATEEGRDHSIGAWQQILNNLKEMVEAGEK